MYKINVFHSWQRQENVFVQRAQAALLFNRQKIEIVFVNSMHDV